MPGKRKPSAKTDEEDRADQNDGSDQGRGDVMPHAQRNIGDVSRAPRHEEFDRAAFPTRQGSRAEFVHPVHQFLRIERARRLLIRHHQKHAHGAIGRRQRLVFLDRVAFGERPDRGADQAERIEIELELRPRRAGLDLFMQSVKALAHFVRLQKFKRVGEGRRIEIQQERQGHSLEIVHAFVRLHGRAGENAFTPCLVPKNVGERRRVFVELVDIFRLAEQSEGQFAVLFEVAIVNFQALDRIKFARQHVDDVAVEREMPLENRRPIRRRSRARRSRRRVAVQLRFVR